MNRLDFTSHDLSPNRPVLRRRGSSASLASSEELGHLTGSQGSHSGGGYFHLSCFLIITTSTDRHYRRSPGHLSNGSLDSSRSRSSSISPIQLRGSERTRTISQPSPPSNSLRTRAQADTTAAQERPSSSLAHSRPSISAHNHRLTDRVIPDRAISPASSITSQDSEQEVQREFQHVRERNWNSPHPKWNLSEEQTKIARRRSQVVSPLPSSPVRLRHDSVTGHGRQPTDKSVNPSEPVLSRNTSTANSLTIPALKRSPSSSSLAVQSSGIPRVRPQTPLPPSGSRQKPEASKTSPPLRGERQNQIHRRTPSSPSHAIRPQGANGVFHSHIPRKTREPGHIHTDGQNHAGTTTHKEEKVITGGEHEGKSSKISMSIEPIEMHDSDFESFHGESE